MAEMCWQLLPCFDRLSDLGDPRFLLLNWFGLKLHIFINYMCLCKVSIAHDFILVSSRDWVTKEIQHESLKVFKSRIEPSQTFKEIESLHEKKAR